MKKFITWMIASALIGAIMLTGCGSTSVAEKALEKAEEKAIQVPGTQEAETEEQVPGTEERAGGIEDVSTDKLDIDLSDLLIKHQAVLIDESDTYSEYLIIFYGEDTHKLMAISDEIHFKKDAGYTETYLRDEFDIDSVYQNFSTFDFTSIDVLDEGDELVYIAWFKDLDKKENFTIMHEEGYLILQEDPAKVTYVDAQSYIDSLTATGDATLVSDLEATERNLHVKLD